MSKNQQNIFASFAISAISFSKSIFNSVFSNNNDIAIQQDNKNKEKDNQKKQPDQNQYETDSVLSQASTVTNNHSASNRSPLIGILKNELNSPTSSFKSNGSKKTLSFINSPSSQKGSINTSPSQDDLSRAGSIASSNSSSQEITLDPRSSSFGSSNSRISSQRSEHKTHNQNGSSRAGSIASSNSSSQEITLDPGSSSFRSSNSRISSQRSEHKTHNQNGSSRAGSIASSQSTIAYYSKEEEELKSQLKQLRDSVKKTQVQIKQSEQKVKGYEKEIQEIKEEKYDARVKNKQSNSENKSKRIEKIEEGKLNTNSYINILNARLEKLNKSIIKIEAEIKYKQEENEKRFSKINDYKTPEENGFQEKREQFQPLTLKQALEKSKDHSAFHAESNKISTEKNNYERSFNEKVKVFNKCIHATDRTTSRSDTHIDMKKEIEDYNAKKNKEFKDRMAKVGECQEKHQKLRGLAEKAIKQNYTNPEVFDENFNLALMDPLGNTIKNKDTLTLKDRTKNLDEVYNKCYTKEGILKIDLSKSQVQENQNSNQSGLFNLFSGAGAVINNIAISIANNALKSITNNQENDASNKKEINQTKTKNNAPETQKKENIGRWTEEVSNNRGSQQSKPNGRGR